MNLRRYLILGVVTLTSSLGDTFLDVGMKKIPPVSLHHLGSLLVAVRTPWIIAGIALLIGFFASYLTALSWADLTYVLPATSLGYVIVALLGKYWLHEQISGERWIGIVLITFGVGFATRGPSYTELPRPEADQRALHPDSDQLGALEPAGALAVPGKAGRS